MPTIKENKIWDEQYDWEQDGDEWSNQADYCRKDYKDWKNSIVSEFISPNINKDKSILEIAPGHGRWTKYFIDKCNKVFLVDLNKKCLDYCRNRFKNDQNMYYVKNNGKKINLIKNNSIDFIWSYDSFVHMEADVIGSYFNEFSRVLKKNGIAVIHHGNRNLFLSKFKFLRKCGKTGIKIYNLFSISRYTDDDGWRAYISNKLIAELVRKNNLKLIRQINSWGKNKEFNVKKYNDFISIILK